LTQSHGPLTVTRHPSEANTRKVYQSGVLKDTRVAVAGPLVNIDHYELCRNQSGTADFFSNRQMAYQAVHQGMTAAETATYHTAIQTLQTALNRQV
jgi:hypothetical protein